MRMMPSSKLISIHRSTLPLYQIVTQEIWKTSVQTVQSLCRSHQQNWACMDEKIGSPFTIQIR